MTWSPLACGIISGKYGNGVPESSRASLKVFSSTPRKESGDRSKGKKEIEQNSSAAACGSLAQAECGLGLAGVPWPAPQALWRSLLLVRHQCRKFSSSGDRGRCPMTWLDS